MSGSAVLAVLPTMLIVGSMWTRTGEVVRNHVGIRHEWCECSCGRKQLVRVNSANELRSSQCNKCSGIALGKSNGGRTRGVRRPSAPREPTAAALEKNTPEKRAWWNMINRTTNPAQRHNSHRYVGRGIRVCDGWTHSYESFLSDMGRRPGSTHSIERRDNDRGYDCGHCSDCIDRAATPNCKWATRSEQQSNTSQSRLVLHRGETLTLAAWAERLGVKPVLFYKLIHKYGFRTAAGAVADLADKLAAKATQKPANDSEAA